MLGEDKKYLERATYEKKINVDFQTKLETQSLSSSSAPQQPTLKSLLMSHIDYVLDVHMHGKLRR